MRKVMEVTHDNDTYSVKTNFESGLDVLNIISMLVTKFKSTAETDKEKRIAEIILMGCMQGRTFSVDEDGEIYVSKEEGELVEHSED